MLGYRFALLQLLHQQRCCLIPTCLWTTCWVAASDGGYVMLAVPPHCGSAVFKGFKWSAASTGMSQIRAAQQLGFRTNIGACYEYVPGSGRCAYWGCETKLRVVPHAPGVTHMRDHSDIDNAEELAAFTHRLRTEPAVVRSTTGPRAICAAHVLLLVARCTG